MKKIAVFDFDETLVKENSLSFLFKYFLGKRPLFTYLLPIFTKQKVSRRTIKNSIKQHFYMLSLNKKSNELVFQAGLDTAEKLTPIKPVVDRMMHLHAQGVEIWIITASPQYFIEGIVNKLQWPVERVIGTLLKEDANVLNGLIGTECQIEEKVARFNTLIAGEKLTCSVEEAYGNLPVDIPMLELAEKKFYVKKGQLSPFINN
ncbi:haloacid dehalogenase-like hydrolase [Pseudoalteromonas sp. SR44-5]|uniref:HAD family hydrolase n=1 Tax=unclassified Pseudoalteromonas TaxID=194690 RepID=UPI0016038FE3|nr:MULTISPECIES: HAD family hydrolase [unclassified Pseudoalteromonas]MBB1367646.1 haloacid dehalogenase-like hydrolase [Pseudoalteromonas sp. SR44-5]MBB1418560.1 haloacid dehalogenase-like hydrolase [Pseudoalteromonas sp. SG44-1]MBB1435474.1 haloacid dehalogenase-like hydrolase [Pseudoalteromonas sp. SG43-6]